MVLNECKLGESKKFNVILENENENNSENSILKNDYTVYQQLESGEYYFNKESMECNKKNNEGKKVHVS